MVISTICSIWTPEEYSALKISQRSASSLVETPKRGDKAAREKMEMVAKVEGIFENISYKPECERIDGDFAVVKVRRIMDGKRRKGRMYLQKFDGEWKIVWKYEYDRAKAARKGR